jgi:hypothetical protein
MVRSRDKIIYAMRICAIVFFFRMLPMLTLAQILFFVNEFFLQKNYIYAGEQLGKACHGH